ncbi:MAG: hypothetical protein QOF41_2918 [Methylobacteriaceae bacterium]|nr:hypothetical protein [Methylobacteriaceae bacterium]
METITWLPLDPPAAASLLRKFEGYSKIQGMLRSRALGFPTQRGFIVDPSTASEEEVLRAAAQLHPSRYLVRHDRAPEIGSYPQGGYIVGKSDLVEELAWYRGQGRLLILLRPADPLDNLYSAAVLLTSSKSFQLDVVGSGFDASDLNRGFISPSESHGYSLPPETPPRKRSSAFIDDDTYAEFKSLRLRKIALKHVLRRRIFKTDDISTTEATSLVASDEIASKPQVRHLLSEEPYTRSPESFLAQIAGYALKAASLLDLPRLGESLLAFSVSQIDNGEHTVIWDIVLPRRKYGLL